MRRRINKQLISIAILATLVTMALMTGMFWRLLRQQIQEDLKSYANLLEESELYRNMGIYETAWTENDVRITWIEESGQVIGDTKADQYSMENHAERPEFLNALRQGEGFEIRVSETLEKSTCYYAKRLADGTVLRVAKDTQSAWKIVLDAIPGLVVSLAFMIVLCVVLANILAKSIIRPLKELAANLDYAEGNTGYKELQPFVKTIRAQHENILRVANVRQEFTANVSHELKTPLTAISGYAELLENGMVQGDAVKHYAREIHHNSDRLLALINDIIHLSEMDRTEYEVSMQPVNLSELAKACAESMKMNAEKRNVSLRYISEPAIVYGNEELLEELLWNLCDNAIRYNNPEGMVKIQIEKDKYCVRLVVSDTGIGIPKEHQERIFERFYRVDKGRSKETGGTGLGLAIVKHIVERHDATISLESALGEGTRITVIFPVYSGE